MVVRLTLLALAGAAGTVARYGVQVGVVQRSGHPALATGFVNVLGCFLLGIAWASLDRRGLLDGDLRLVVATGLLGAFTTFSALLLDSALLAREHSLLTAAANVVGQVALGLVALGLGALVGRLA